MLFILFMLFMLFMLFVGWLALFMETPLRFRSERRGNSSPEDTCPYSANGEERTTGEGDECADWDWTNGEWVGDEKACVGDEVDVGDKLLLLRKGKEEASVETGGTGKEGASEAARPKEEERGSGLLLVRRLLGDPARGLCLMFLSTLR